jgi:hypothetical protein
MKKVLITLIGSLSVFYSYAQLNTGQNVFNFLNHSTSARMTAMGGTLVGSATRDVSAAWFNPAVLHQDMSGQVSFNYDNVFAGIGSSYLGYAQQVKRLNMTFHAGLQALSYGTFDGTDEYANAQGSFKGQDLALAIGAARPLSERWSLGMNLKLIHSALETYTASGISADVGALYNNSDKRFSFGIIAKNAGTQLGTYAGEGRGKLPFEVQLGFVKRLKHLPFQYALTYRNAETWNLTYKDPATAETVDFLGQPVKGPSKFVQGLDNLGRHLVFGGELLLGKKENFVLRLGYAHLLKKELGVSPFRSLTGFSYGFGFKIKRFRLDLGRSTTHMAGAMTHFSFATNLSEFRKK